jgi:hypothetical protein
MPIGTLTVPTSAPVDTTLAYAMTQVQAALDTISAFVNALETTDGQRVSTAAASAIAAATANALLSITQSGAGNAVENYNAGAVLTAALTKAGVLTLGDNPTSGYFEGATQLRVVGGINGLVASLLAALGANANGHDLRFFKSRTTSLTARDNVLADDEMGRIVFEGDTGASDEESVAIVAEVDGTIYSEVAISTIARVTNTVTVNTASAHNWTVGDVIIVTGCSHSAFNGTFTVLTTPLTTRATWAQTASDDSDNTGTAAKRNMPGRLVLKVRTTNSTSLQEAMRIDSNFRVVVGGIAADTSGPADKFQVHRSGANVAGVYGYTTGAAPAELAILRSKNNTVGSKTTLAANDYAARLGLYGYLGSAWAGLAAIDAKVESVGPDSGQLIFSTNYGGALIERLTLNSVGTLRLMDTYSGGIQFPATQVAMGGANILDDFEKGTFTPRIDGTTAAGAGTYTAQVGAYTKIGNVVTVRGVITWTAHTGTGNMIVEGLPFTSANVANLQAAVALSYSNLTFAAALHGFVSVASTKITLKTSATGAAEADLAIDAAATLRFEATYQTDN